MLDKRNSVRLESRKQGMLYTCLYALTCGVEMVKDREARCAVVHGVTVRPDLVIEQQECVFVNYRPW